MNPNVSTLLHQGLTMTVLGMGLVFAGLGLLWGLIVLLNRTFAPKPGEQAPGSSDDSAVIASAAEVAEVEAAAAEALTVERAHVAAVVAGALMANALPWLIEAPAGPAFEHGRSASSWVTANRSRTLRSWQPQRFH